MAYDDFDDDDTLDLTPVQVEHEEPIPNFAEMDINNLAALSVQYRDDVKEKTKEYKLFKARKKDLMQRISMAVRDKADALNVEAFPTKSGTFYRTVNHKYRVGNWENVLGFIVEHKYWHMLERRIGKVATREIHQSTGELPPGVEYLCEVSFTVRRPTKRAI